MTKKIFSALKVSALALLLSFGLSYVYAWTSPTLNPPAGNVSAPINTSATAQTKAGDFTVNTQVSTPKYCMSNNGTNCITTWPAGGVADNLGNHSATQGLAMNNYLISNTSGLYLNSAWGVFYAPNLYGQVAGTWTTTPAGEGKVLTSDGTGYATWRTPAAAPAGVTGLTAGTGITLSPAGPGATGVVTVNAAAPPTYKGFYQVDDLNACRFSNVATGACSCPGGSSPTQIGHMTVMAVRNPAVLVWGAMYACGW